MLFQGEYTKEMSKKNLQKLKQKWPISLEKLMSLRNAIKISLRFYLFIKLARIINNNKSAERIRGTSLLSYVTGWVYKLYDLSGQLGNVCQKFEKCEHPLI